MRYEAPLTLNRECYCDPVDRDDIVSKIVAQNAAPNMKMMLAQRPNYFANTRIFLSGAMRTAMLKQIRAIEEIIKLPAYQERVKERSPSFSPAGETPGVFMGYDFHFTSEGPRLIEINSNAGGAFIVNMIQQTGAMSTIGFAQDVMAMFQSEWNHSGRDGTFQTVAIVDENPVAQYHYPDMCLAKSLLEASGVKVFIADPNDLHITNGKLFRGDFPIDLVYNRLTDFDLSNAGNQVIARAYEQKAAVITPAPDHHALYADKRNLILLSDQKCLADLGASESQRKVLNTIPKTFAVTEGAAQDMWARRRSLFFKPQAGFGSRGAFRGAKLTKKVWREILQGGYIAQKRILPPLRAVTVAGQQTTLKFDVRVYTYSGNPLLFAARIYQGQTTNLRTAGGGLAAILPLDGMSW